MILCNSQGQVFYGLHFYSGVAEYHPPDREAFRVFINEATIRSMGPSFAARPVFVMHVDGVEQDINELRKEADGWVVESFYNEADGKHWVKFMVVSDRGKRAIAQGMKLSNAYAPKRFGNGGTWNGVTYDKEVLAGEYEHLALVPDPRYAESVILTPEQFKTYNDEKRIELQRLANQKEKGQGEMKFKIFKRSVVENSAVDVETMMVELPKSKREVSISQLVNEADEDAEKKKKEKDEPPMANGDHMVEYGGKKMSLNDMMGAHKTLNDELAALKAKHYDDVAHRNEEDDEEKKKKEKMENAEKELMEKHKNELEALRAGKPVVQPTADELETRRRAKEAADLVRNAEDRARKDSQSNPPEKVEFVKNQVQRGQARYGSN